LYKSFHFRYEHRMTIKASRVLQNFMRSVFFGYICNIGNLLLIPQGVVHFVMFLKDFFNDWQQEYVQKTDPTSAPLSFKDEQKNEVLISIALFCFYLYYYLVSFSFVMCFISLCNTTLCSHPFIYLIIHWILILVLVIRQACCLRDSVWSWMPFLILTLLQNLYDINVLIISFDRQYTWHLKFVFLFALNWTEQVIEDMSIQANVPALAMEEVKNYFFLIKFMFLLLPFIIYWQCIMPSLGRLHLWLFQMLLCWHLRRYLMGKVILRKKQSLQRQKGKQGELIRKENLKVPSVMQ